MSGPYHERAVCPCGWSIPAPFGLENLRDRCFHINVCPQCGNDKAGMQVRVLRWHERTWRDQQGIPYNGVEPEPEPASNASKWIATVIAILVILAFVFWPLLS